MSTPAYKELFPHESGFDADGMPEDLRDLSRKAEAVWFEIAHAGADARLPKGVKIAFDEATQEASYSARVGLREKHTVTVQPSGEGYWLYTQATCQPNHEGSRSDKILQTRRVFPLAPDIPGFLTKDVGDYGSAALGENPEQFVSEDRTVAKPTEPITPADQAVIAQTLSHVLGAFPSRG